MICSDSSLSLLIALNLYVMMFVLEWSEIQTHNEWLVLLSEGLQGLVHGLKSTSTRRRSRQLLSLVEDFALVSMMLFGR